MVIICMRILAFCDSDNCLVRAGVSSNGTPEIYIWFHLWDIYGNIYDNVDGKLLFAFFPNWKKKSFIDYQSVVSARKYFIFKRTEFHCYEWTKRIQFAEKHKDLNQCLTPNQMILCHRFGTFLTTT